MNLHDSIGSVPKFGIGQSPSRKEDRRLVSGGGRYTDDVHEPGELFAVFRRSEYAHALLRGVNGDAARALDGVVAVLDAGDLEGNGYRTLGCGVPLEGEDGAKMIVPPHPSLARDRLRYVGQPVALVIARDAVTARAAAELVELDVEPLEVVSDLAEALADGAPQLHEEVPGNCPVIWSWGDHAAVDAAIENGDVRGYLQHNHLFHARLYAHSGAEVLIAISEMLWLRSGPPLRVMLGRHGTANLPDMHREALAAMRARDPEAVAAAILGDIDQGIAQVNRSLS